MADTSAAIWLPRTQRELTSNFDARPAGALIELVVVHNIALPPGEFGTGLVVDLFCNRLDCSVDARLADLAGVRVSSHLFLDRRGRATQFVPFNARAWHAGVSSWRGRSGCNDYAIGIELEGVDEVPYTQAQYQRLGGILRWLCRRFPRIEADAVVGHNEIATGRKTDPGSAFDWSRVIADLASA
jgi:AmpD protein